MAMGKMDGNKTKSKKFTEEELLLASAEFRDQCMDRFKKLAKEKYDKGQAEHGGYLPIDVTLSELEDEVIDQWFYLQAVKAKLHALCPKEEFNFYENMRKKRDDGRQYDIG